MSNTLKVPSNISAQPAKVRAWLEAQGMIAKGQRGRFSQAQIAAYNARHKGFGSYREALYHDVPVAKLGKSAKARKVNAEAARALLIDNGFSVPVRGRLSNAQVAAAVALSEGQDVSEVKASLVVQTEAASLRAVLLAAGVEVGKRGRMSAAQIATARELAAA